MEKRINEMVKFLEMAIKTLDIIERSGIELSEDMKSLKSDFEKVKEEIKKPIPDFAYLVEVKNKMERMGARAEKPLVEKLEIVATERSIFGLNRN